LNLSPVAAATSSVEDEAAATRVDGSLNRWFLDPVLRGSYPADLVEHYAALGAEAPVEDGDLEITSRPIDFLGVNYYTRRTVASAPGADTSPMRLEVRDAPSPELARTMKGWTIEPDGLTELLVRIHDDYGDLPLYITENGAAFNDYVDPTGEVRDLERIDFLDSHLRAAHAAIGRGVDLRGYFLWSLLDNFEWADGYSMRFGIVHVDYGTKARVPKQSASWYAKVVQANALG
jgi:beta-glucosidase